MTKVATQVPDIEAFTELVPFAAMTTVPFKAVIVPVTFLSESVAITLTLVRRFAALSNWRGELLPDEMVVGVVLNCPRTAIADAGVVTF
jgi:hypothetical protein